MWNRCKGNGLQLIGFWNFFIFFRFFPLKLVYFLTKSKKNIYGYFFHSFCATDLHFGTKNIGGMKYSTLTTVIFASYWGSPLVQFSKFKNFLWACWFLCKNLLILYPSLENSATPIAMVNSFVLTLMYVDM